MTHKVYHEYLNQNVSEQWLAGLSDSGLSLMHKAMIDHVDQTSFYFNCLEHSSVPIATLVMARNIYFQAMEDLSAIRREIVYRRDFELWTSGD